MKFLLVFLFPFFVSAPSSDFTPPTDNCEDEALRVRICWKGPKGNRTCITVSGGIRDTGREEFMTSAFLATDGSSMLLDMSGSGVTKSLKLAESVKVETCGSSLSLKAGSEIDVVNGYAVLR